MSRLLKNPAVILALLTICLAGCLAGQAEHPAQRAAQDQNIFSLPTTILKSDAGLLTLTVDKPRLSSGAGQLALQLAQGIIDSSYLLEGKTTFLGGAEVKIIRVSADKVMVRLVGASQDLRIGSRQDIYLERKTIAIKDFEVIRGSDKDVARYVQEDVTTALVNSGQFNVLERMKLASVLAEIKLSQTGLVDPKSAKRAGRLLGADLILTGTFVQTGADWHVNLRLVNTETGLIVTAIKRVGPLVEFRKTALRATGPIAGSFEGGQSLDGWIMGEKQQGRTGKGGYSRVYVAKEGAKRSNASLAMDFKLGLERLERKRKKSIYAGLANNLQRDLSMYSGISFRVKASKPMTVVYALFDGQKGSGKDEQWLLPFPVKEDWRQVDIPFHSLTLNRKRANRLGTDGILELHLVEGMVWIVSEKHVSRGTEGTLWLDEISFY